MLGAARSPLPGQLSDPPEKAWAGTFAADVPPNGVGSERGGLSLFFGVSVAYAFPETTSRDTLFQSSISSSVFG